MLAVSSQVVGQGLLVYALGHLEPVVAGLCLLVQPVISGTVGWIVYGERLGPGEFMGAAMIGTALVLNRRPNRAVTPPADRKSLGEGKRVSVRGELRVSRI